MLCCYNSGNALKSVRCDFVSGFYLSNVLHTLVPLERHGSVEDTSLFLKKSSGRARKVRPVCGSCSSALGVHWYTQFCAISAKSEYTRVKSGLRGDRFAGPSRLIHLPRKWFSSHARTKNAECFGGPSGTKCSSL